MKARRYEIGNWIEEEKENIIGLRVDRNRIANEFVNTLINGSIQEWENENGSKIKDYSNKYKIKIEKLSKKFLSKILKFTNFVYWRVIHFLFEKRENSLLRKDHEIIEFLLAHLIDWIIEKDENGENKDISINTSIVRPPAVYNSLSITPEQVLHDKDFYEKVKKLLAFVVGSGRRHASKYQPILEMELLSEIHVTSEYGPLLGVPNEQVPSLRHQTFKLAKDTTKKKFPELSDTIENLDRGVTHKIKKSTKKEIEKFNQLNSEDESKKHGPIREWKPETGWKTIPYEEALKKRVKVPRRRRKKKVLVRPKSQIKIPVPILDQ